MDTAQYWTFVYNQAYGISGEITHVDVFVGATGRRLKLGIYRPEEGVCNFRLVQEYTLASLPKGKYTVKLTEICLICTFSQG